MQLLEYGQRFLNFKALISVRNSKTGKVEFSGMFVDCPYRYLRFADVDRVEIDNDLGIMDIYVLCNSPMYYNTQTHFLVEVTAEEKKIY
jgi:hypothetical protein